MTQNLLFPLGLLVVVLQQRHQQLICKVKNQSATSETGGWCNLAVGRSHLTDNRLAGALADLFIGRTVVGLGDGRGLYRKIILGTGKVQKYDAYDGSPNINNITGGQVIWRCFYRAMHYVHSAVLRLHGVCPSVCPSVCL